MKTPRKKSAAGATFGAVAGKAAKSPAGAVAGKIMMKGGSSKMKKYKLGSAVNDGPGDGRTDAYTNAAKNPVNEKIAMDALGIKKPKPKPQSVFPNMNKPGLYDNVRSSKYGGTAKTKMKTGGMVNSNAKLSADKTPGSKGTKVGLNKKINKPKK